MMLLMLAVILQSLILASGGILSVGSITLVIMLLISKRGWRNGLGYMLGYISAYTLIGIAFVLVGYNATDKSSGEQGIVVPIMFVILGLLLLYFTQHNWRKPPGQPGSNSNLRLFAIVDKATPRKTFAFGIIVSVINIKNLAIFLSAISIVHLSNLVLAEKIICALLVTFVFCLSVIVPVVIFILFPHRSNEALNWIKRTLERHSRAIGIWVPFIFGLIFIYRGITELR